MAVNAGRFEWRGSEYLRRARAEAADGLEAGMELVLAESRQVVPLEEGTLERSGAAHVDRAALRGAVSYDTPYAVRQHEELDYKHAPGRTAKYLETPFHASKLTVLALIAAAIRRADHRA
ncbi:hypothetical protein ACFVX9_30335 [Kitasatospora sp. NPDC058243]|uniref:hypothetical protein n=1 Tax=Kitasatospora sp. NPDC058243 TaxID=3346397 RepID=UPI0036DF1081